MPRSDNYFLPATPHDEGIGVRVTLVNKNNETIPVRNEDAKLVIAMLPSKKVSIRHMVVTNGNLELELFADFEFDRGGMVEVTVSNTGPTIAVNDKGEPIDEDGNVLTEDQITEMQERARAEGAPVPRLDFDDEDCESCQ